MENDQALPTKRLRARYGNKSEKTIERWIKKGILPPPFWINGRRHWWLSVLEQHERDGMGRRKAPGDGGRPKREAAASGTRAAS